MWRLGLFWRLFLLALIIWWFITWEAVLLRMIFLQDLVALQARRLLLKIAGAMMVTLATVVRVVAVWVFKVVFRSDRLLYFFHIFFEFENSLWPYIRFLIIVRAFRSSFDSRIGCCHHRFKYWLPGYLLLNLSPRCHTPMYLHYRWRVLLNLRWVFLGLDGELQDFSSLFPPWLPQPVTTLWIKLLDHCVHIFHRLLQVVILDFVYE